MIRSTGISVSVAALLIIVALPYVLYTCKAAESISTSLIAKTDEAIKIAFNEVLDAEKAGAAVTDMLSTLNRAVTVLCQAERVNESLVPSISESDLNRIQGAYESALNVKVAAMNAKDQALNASRNYLLSTVALSLVGSIVFVLILFMLWRRYKQVSQSVRLD